jgi:alkanesulfonate monooxygenase SsuD/methylene tetrahydromethanopterin reductase-like flavin-dependent oxidoreductase (luciferase family)
MDQAEANGIWEAVTWWYRTVAEFTLQWEFPNITQEERDAQFPLLQQTLEGEIPVDAFHAADMFVVGDPEQCFEKMKRYADFGVDQMVCRVEYGHLSHESIMKNIELLGKEVLPELEKYTPARPVAR